MHFLFQSLGWVPEEIRGLFFFMGGLSAAVFLVGTLDRLLIWRQGKEGPDRVLLRQRGAALYRLSLQKLFSIDCLLARRTFGRSRLRGLMLVCIMWGSFALLAGVIYSALAYAFPVVFGGLAARAELSIAMDIGGALLLLGLLGALARRYVFRPARWVTASGDGMAVGLLALTAALGFAMEAVRLAPSGVSSLANWPVGGLLGMGLRGLTGEMGDQGWDLYRVLYVLHGGSAFALVAYLPFSRLFHIFASQITTFAARREAELQWGGRVE